MMLVKLFIILICTLAYGAKVRKISPPTIEVDVSRALQQANGDINTAQVMMFIDNQ